MIEFSTFADAPHKLNYKSVCYGNVLSYATAQNKEALKIFINDIKSGGSTYNGRAMSRALEVLNHTKLADDAKGMDTSQRSK